MQLIPPVVLRAWCLMCYLLANSKRGCNIPLGFRVEPAKRKTNASFFQLGSANLAELMGKISMPVGVWLQGVSSPSKHGLGWPGWWAVPLATYCQNRMKEHPRYKSTQYRSVYEEMRHPIGFFRSCKQKLNILSLQRRVVRLLCDLWGMMHQFDLVEVIHIHADAQNFFKTWRYKEKYCLK